MSELFPNAVYVPTGQADGKDFVKFSGYCYKKVSDNITVLDTPVRSLLSDSFEDCLDCNSCKCGKQIDFIVGGFLYDGSDISYQEKTLSITTSSTGWQEIAIESGYLNTNPNTNKPDDNLNFKPVQIKCYDRKIDISGGLYATFNDRNAEIAQFQYVTGSDLYERKELFSENLADNPDWSYQNQYDLISYANKLNTIKFKSLCEYECPTQDITFRIRGRVFEDPLFVNYHTKGDEKINSWVYATCTGMPTTPGQIIECIPSGDGINLTEYFAGDFAPDQSYKVQMKADRVEVVNLPLLLGETGSSLSKFYSNSGSGSLEDEMFFAEGPGTRSLYYNYYSGLYYLRDLFDTDGNINYSDTIGSMGLTYNRMPNCLDSAITGSDFNEFYRHVGANTFAITSELIENDGSDLDIGDSYTGCYQASEYVDGIFKVGTYTLMKFTGVITGNAQEYLTFIDSNIATAPDSWSSGIYVYQWYKSGDQSHANNNIDGFFGFLHDLDDPEEQLAHFESVANNHSPVNLGDPLLNWHITSGNYPPLNAEKVGSSVIVNFGDNQSYQTRFSMANGIVRHYHRKSEFADENIYNNYLFEAGDEDSAINYLNNPEYASNTFVKTTGIAVDKLLIDSGNILHNPNNPITQDPVLDEIKSIKFQLSWNK